MQWISRHKKPVILLVVVIMIAVIVGAWRALHPVADHTLMPQKPSVPQSFPKTLVLPPPPQVRDMAQPESPDNEPPLLWEPADVASPVTLSEQVAEQRVVKMDRRLLLSLRSGDSVQLTLPDGSVVMAQIVKTVENPGGDKTLHAQIKTDFGDYPFIYTIGVTTGSGFIGVPDGRYSIETRDVYSVVYRNPEPLRPLDPSKKDYVIPIQKR